MKGKYLRPSELLRLQKETGKSYWDLIGRPLYDDGKDVSEESSQQATPDQISALQYLIGQELDKGYDKGKDSQIVPYEVPDQAALNWSDAYGLTGDLMYDANYQQHTDSDLSKYQGGKSDQRRGKLYTSAFNESIRGRNKQVVDDVIDYFLGTGVDPMLISGIVGNMAQESRFDPNVSDSTSHVGLAQMSKDMQKEVKRVYGNTSWQSQIRFIHDAMSGNKRISSEWRDYMTQKGGYYGNKYKNPYSAAMSFGRVFERPDEKLANWRQRGLSAREAYDYILGRAKNQGYDMKRAIDLGYTRDETGHMPSRDYETGRILKSPAHPTILKTLAEESRLGYTPVLEPQTIKPDGFYTNTWTGNEFVQSLLSGFAEEGLKKPTFITSE